jgi:hypothetical protein
MKGNRMRKYAPLLFVAFVSMLFLAGSASAQAMVRTDVPPVLLSGMDAYKPGNPEQAIKASIKNSPLDGTPGVAGEAVNLREAQGMYGHSSGSM